MRSPIRTAFVLVSLMTAVSACADQKGAQTMDHATRERITAAAAASRHWDAADIAIKPNEDLDRGECRFLLAYNPHAPGTFPANFAVLPDGRIAGAAGVDVTGNAAATALLRTCGQQADADWWAAVVTRFSDQAGGMPLTKDSFSSQIKEVEATGATFQPPTLKHAGGASTLEFFSLGTVMPVGGYIPYHVTAVLPEHGSLTIQRQKLSQDEAPTH